MKEHLKAYKAELEKSIGEYMERPATERSAEAINGMIKCWKHINEAEEMLSENMYGSDFTHDDASAWADSMVNEDGTMGPHWNIDQTTAVARANGVMFDHITDWCWWVTMNMMYSDYYAVAEKYGVGTPDYFADLAKAFLFDKDGPKPEKKLCAYYKYIVKKGG